MFYEARTHELLPVKDAAEAAQLIKSRNLSGYKVPTWQTEDGQVFLAVNDAHIDDSNFAETAILKKTADGYIQIETITAAWINTPEELARYFNQAMTGTVDMGRAQIIIGQPTGNESAWFTCGCCGEGFKGNVKQQQKFGQDAGYGICPACTKYYS